MKDSLFFIIMTVSVVLLSASCASTVNIVNSSEREIQVVRLTRNGDFYPLPVDKRNWREFIQPGKSYSFQSYHKDERVLLKLQIPFMPLQTATQNAFFKLSDNIKENSRIAIINIASSDKEDGEYVADLISTNLVNTRKFSVMERNRLDVIRAEQKLQLSGDVSDNTAVSIGKMVGADIVITGTIRIVKVGSSILGAYGTRQLVIKALDVQTAQIVAMASEM